MAASRADRTHSSPEPVADGAHSQPRPRARPVQTGGVHEAANPTAMVFVVFQSFFTQGANVGVEKG